MRRLGMRLVLVCLGAAASALAACHEVGSNPNAAVSMEFDSIPAPSVVVGDTMRDSTGAAVPLRAHAFNARDQEIATAAFRFFTSDSLSAHVSNGYLIADSATTVQQKVFAQVVGSGIPAAGLAFSIVRSPDSLTATQAGVRDTLHFVFGDTSVTDTAQLTVRVLHVWPQPHVTPDSTTGVGSWIVRYTITHPTDTLFVQLVDASGHRSRADTTDASGSATRQVHIRPSPLTPQSGDSIVVQAHAFYKGVEIAGSPVTWIIPYALLTP